VLHDVERIADRFGFINEGELVTTRAPHELVTEHADHFIVRYQSSDLSMAEGTALRQGEYEREITQDELPHWLTRLNAVAGRVVSIKPAVSLESVFFQILEERQRKPQSTQP
jgi:ABC-2 type transport system ATP-binding protein